MSKPLVVVESPAKAKTISRFLGDAYDVRASVGHVADLPSKGLAVDVDNGFKPTYELTDRGKQVVKELRAALEGRQRAVPRDGRGPRGRGDQLAPRRAPQAEGAGETDGVPRDHRGRHRPRRRQPARHRLRARRRRRDAPDPRPPLRLRGVARAVATGQPRPVGRSGAEPVDPPRSSSASASGSRSSAAGYWDIELTSATAPSFTADLVGVDGTLGSPPAGTSTPAAGRRAMSSSSTRPRARTLADGLAGADVQGALGRREAVPVARPRRPS